MTGWHAPESLIARYADGSLPDSDAWSLEKHLESCAACAGRVSGAVRATAAGAVLAQVRGAVLDAAPPVRAKTPVRTKTPVRAKTPAPPTRAKTPVRAKAPLHTPRLLWAAAPAVRGAWLPAVLLVALGAVLLAHVADFSGARPLLLAVAPVVPVAGVALSYGRHADPLHELAASTPSAGLRLVLTRTVLVLAVSLPLLTLAGVVLPASDAPGAAAWLLPGLTLTLAALALGGWLGLRAATAVTGGGWLCAVLAPALAAPGGAVSRQLSDQLSTYVGGAATQGGWAVAAAACAALLAARRTTYDRLERH
ncbi:zf-HC2 domain-containing protein [Streptomyces sp. G1]|uniref:zf-HC2 domain-containing protein n=1 Tax=Streptomyces sp. G1 TaxID=361572 RepID=UPI00202EF7EF|nr:zf-HC2 domain-containing protein [Streptomyces sp. G1]MCM1968456.1 zf-HC2 domain-containing protein [Streptomyces sp. G1]